jgi:hypothetical protein
MTYDNRAERTPFQSRLHTENILAQFALDMSAGLEQTLKKGGDYDSPAYRMTVHPERWQVAQHVSRTLLGRVVGISDQAIDETPLTPAQLDPHKPQNEAVIGIDVRRFEVPEDPRFELVENQVQLTDGSGQINYWLLPRVDE